MSKNITSDGTNSNTNNCYSFSHYYY